MLGGRDLPWWPRSGQLFSIMAIPVLLQQVRAITNVLKEGGGGGGGLPVAVVVVHIH